MILSVDLASRRYRDNGIALMSGRVGDVRVELVAPESSGLAGEPCAERFADALCALADARGARLILIDGPQGWRAETSPNVHARDCERATLTPGKTGPPGVVLPRSWTRMATFSVALFDRLHDAGWPRLGAAWRGERVAIESFPTHAWRTLGCDRPLPGKAHATDLGPWQRWLETHCLGAPLGPVTHDELQAVVGGLAGLQMLDGGVEAVMRCGRPPHVEGGDWREGYIVSPSRGRSSHRHRSP